MRYIKGDGWVSDSADYYCMGCREDKGEIVGSYPHGSLVDHNFECPCGCSWTFITEGEVLHRYQFVYRRD